MDLASLTTLATPWFPVEAGRHSVQLVELVEHGEDVHAVLRLIGWESDRSSVRDIKEQPVLFLRADQRDDPRIAAALEGWALALTDAADQAADPGDRLERCMPHDLWFLPQLLDLKRATSVADFVDALLRSRSRLGWLAD